MALSLHRRQVGQEITIIIPKTWVFASGVDRVTWLEVEVPPCVFGSVYAFKHWFRFE